MLAPGRSRCNDRRHRGLLQPASETRRAGRTRVSPGTAGTEENRIMNLGRTMVWLRGSLARWEVFLLFVLIGTFICGAQVSQYFLAPSNISIALAGMTPPAVSALPRTVVMLTGQRAIAGWRCV